MGYRRGNKYNAKPVTIDNIWFASQKEGKRYSELKLLLKAGEISNLELQPKFAIEINEIPVFDYFADFSYLENGRAIIEDAKGVRTALYKLKKKCVEAYYRIVITEV